MVRNICFHFNMVSVTCGQVSQNFFSIDYANPKVSRKYIFFFFWGGGGGPYPKD